MQIEGKVVVVTGGASGIGRALAQEVTARGAAGVVVADRNAEWAHKVAERIGGLAVVCDVGEPGAVEALADAANEAFGRVDIFCSNAGYVDSTVDGLAQSMDDFLAITRVNMLAHVAAAKAVVPGMIERGGGYLLQTLSSAALVSGAAPPGYTMSKFGALGFAEWLAVHHGSQGIRVSCLCPNLVYTGMFGRPLDLDAPVTLPDGASLGEVLLPEDVARQTVDAMEGDEPFLILPHARVGESFRRKAEDYDRWLAGTRERVAAMVLPKGHTDG